MRALLIALTALMLGAPMTALGQVDEQAPSSTEESIDREALREELTQARREVAEAARKLARIQRQLVDTNAGAVHLERLEALEELQELESIERELAGMDEQIRHRVVAALGMGGPRLGVLLGGIDLQGQEDANAIVGVTPGSGAEKAGIRAGDRLVSINGQTVDASDPASLRAPLKGVDKGETVPVEIERDGEPMSVEVAVSSPARDIRIITHDVLGPPHMPGAPRAPGAPGIDREVIVLEGQGHRIPAPPLAPRLAGLGRHSNMISNHAGLEPYFGTAEGVVVLRIDADNPLQLKDGDVVLSIDGESVSRPVEIGRALLGRRGESVTLEVMRDGETVTIEAELPEAKTVSALMQTLLPGL